MAKEISPDAVLDARGEKCPIPVARAAKWLKTATPGATLRVESTDPASVPDFKAWATTDQRLELLEQSEAGGLFIHLVRRT